MTSAEFAAGLRQAYDETASYENVEFRPSQYSQALQEMERDSRFQVDRSSSGEILSLNALQAINAGSGLIFLDNSNLLQSSSGVGNATARIPLTVTEGAGTIDDPRMWEKGVKTVSTGSKVLAIADRLSLAAAGVSIGCKLGKVVDETLYNINPDFWDKNLPTLNPQTWTTIAGDNEFGRNVINVLFGIDDNDEMSMYVPEDVFAYYLYMLYQQGAWSTYNNYNIINGTDISNGEEFIITSFTDLWALIQTLEEIYNFTIEMSPEHLAIIQSYDSENMLAMATFTTMIIESGRIAPSAWGFVDIYFSDRYSIGDTIKNGQVIQWPYNLRPRASFNGNERKVSIIDMSRDNNGNNYSQAQFWIGYRMLAISNVNVEKVSLTVTKDEPSERAPIEVNPDVILDIDPTGNFDLNGTLNNLKLELPDFYNDAVYQKTINEDGSENTKIYIKVPIPDNIDTPYPTTGEPSQLNPSITINSPTAQKIIDLTINSNQNPVNNPNPAPTNNTETIKDVIFQIINNINPEITIDDIPDTLVPDIQNIIDNSDYPYPNPDPTTVTDTIRDTITTQIPDIDPLELPDSTIQNIIDTVTGNPSSNPDGSIPTTGNDTVGEPTTGIPPITNTGESPEIIPVDDPASALWAIYNPSASTLTSFGNWLWTTNIWEMIKQMFENPVDAIIGIHKIFVNPITGGNQNIKCGYLDSGIAAPVVAKQYVTMNCGWVGIGETFGNVFDYAPYTRISMFLPFIGFVNIDPADVMRGRVNVKYTVDVLTGSCLSEISVERDNCTSVLYSYTGNCAVTYPVTQGSYLGMLIGALQLGASTFVAAESPEAAMAIAPNPNSMRVNVSHSGHFGANAGAMGGKVPYVVITTPQVKMAENFESFDGVGANAIVAIGACSGYVKCKEVHLQVSAYEEEIKEIEQMLYNGILI